MTNGEVELLATDELGRVRTPAAKREAILDEFERSGMTAIRFAKHIGVKYTTFGTWVAKRRKSRHRGEAPGEGNDQPPRRSLALVEAVVERAGSSGMVRVKLSGGVEITVSDSGQVELVAELVRALRSG
ncbi:MAG TPA: IS66 family insertion sequence hypothetical protein [Firmicutes bacterium]|nr:IS66 family insertion sequence hypothetical protein [Bacillota bacterium]